jgi:hypothetical protein
LTKREAVGVVLVLAIGFTALAGTLDIEVLADVFAIVGFVVCLPLVGILGERLPFVTADDGGSTASTAADGVFDDPDEADEADEAVAQLRERYARGEIDETKFEHRLEALLETEDVGATTGTDRDRVTELE